MCIIFRGIDADIIGGSGAVAQLVERLHGQGPGGARALGSRTDDLVPKKVQPLPADGTILEEGMANIQSEYGTPATPQEFRLVLKFPDSITGSQPSTQIVSEEPVDEEEPVDPPR